MERILVCVAWPYANGSLHLGHIAGAYLPADIFARYHRARGSEVLMVSGSDQHGTPITIRAEQENTTPEQVASRYHAEFLDSWRRLGIEFDLFTTTGTANHARVVHDIFNTLLRKGHIYRDSMPQPFCPRCQRYLPDRYVNGTCPFCDFTEARGDQCDRCGKPTNPLELKDPRCRLCGSAPEARTSEHFFLRLSAFQEPLLAWVKEQRHWRPNVQNFTLRYLEEGLKDRAITRDIEWGVSIPQPGFEQKRIYVWFEAVIGYLSACHEWGQQHGRDDAWSAFWQQEARSYYFIGKDNIPFHTMIWPAMLMGYGGLNLPYDVPANEFLTIEGRKLSTSRNWAVWVPDYLERYSPDPLRYFLSANMPEASDADFSWREFVRRNNDELVATYGNLAHRVLTFTSKHFEGRVPTPGELDASSRALLEKARTAFGAVDSHLHNCHFRDAIKATMLLAQDTNRYLDEKSPWKTLKTDRAACATSLYVSLSVINTLKTLFYPFLPESSQKLHRLLGGRGFVKDEGWAVHELPAGQKLGAPEALFVKLDEAVVAGENARLGQAPGETA